MLRGHEMLTAGATGLFLGKKKLVIIGLLGLIVINFVCLVSTFMLWSEVRRLSVVGIRGATTADNNTAAAILSASEELVREVLSANKLRPSDDFHCHPRPHSSFCCYRGSYACWNHRGAASGCRRGDHRRSTPALHSSTDSCSFLCEAGSRPTIYTRHDSRINVLTSIAAASFLFRVCFLLPSSLSNSRNGTAYQT
jgi:hypothetical protein